MAILSKQIGWSQEANLIYELIKQTDRLNQILPGNQPSYGVRRMSQMIGWSQEAKLYYEWLRQLDKVTQHYGCPDCTPTTTTTTTAAPVDSTIEVVSIDPSYFDIPFYGNGFGCWVKMDNDLNFPRIFSIGQYPTAAEAISIEGGTLYFWYNESILATVPLTSYIGNWIWIAVTSDIFGAGNFYIYINGTQVTAGSYPFPSNIGLFPMFIGSENAPNTYLKGNIAGFIFQAIGGGSIDLTIPPTTPFVPDGGTTFLIGQGGNLATQLTNQGLIPATITNINCTYSTDSPYGPGYGGSLRFG